MKIVRSVLDGLGFDLAAAVAAFAAAKEAHRSTIGVPAPTAHPLVEQVFLEGGTFEVVEAASGAVEGSGTTFGERLSALEAWVAGRS